jgi:flavin-dependent dehydrogenase
VISIKIDIVGGSLSGLSTAITIKEIDTNIDVIVHEKNYEIGYNREGRRCGEGYSCYHELTKWHPSGKSIFNEIKKVEYIIGNKTYKMPISSRTNSVVVLNKQEFIACLGRKAVTLGVEVCTNDRIKSASDLDGKYIVDASGFPSVIRRQLGLTQGRFGICYQQTLQNSNFFISDTMRMFFLGTMGYYWIFPRDPRHKEINLGVGVTGDRDVHLKEILEAFKEERGIKGTVDYVTGGCVPAGVQHPLMYENILFVGDAGVGAVPITGEGIPAALHSGEIAGRCIATGHAKHYPYQIHCKFIKWDVLGKAFADTGLVLQKIGPKAYGTALSYFFQYFYLPMAYKK